MKPTSSTALATWMLDHLTLGARNESLSGDLLEELHSGRSTAWYWRQTISAIAITLCHPHPRLRCAAFILSRLEHPLSHVVARHRTQRASPKSRQPLHPAAIYPSPPASALSPESLPPPLFIALGFFVYLISHKQTRTSTIRLMASLSDQLQRSICNHHRSAPASLRSRPAQRLARKLQRPPRRTLYSAGLRPLRSPPMRISSSATSPPRLPRRLSNHAGHIPCSTSPQQSDPGRTRTTKDSPPRLVRARHRTQHRIRHLLLNLQAPIPHALPHHAPRRPDHLHPRRLIGGIFGTWMMLPTGEHDQLRTLSRIGLRGWLFLPTIALFLHQGSPLAPLIAIISATLIAMSIHRQTPATIQPHRTHNPQPNLFTTEIQISPSSWLPLVLSLCLYAALAAATQKEIELVTLLLAIWSLVVTLQINAAQPTTSNQQPDNQPVLPHRHGPPLHIPRTISLRQHLARPLPRLGRSPSRLRPKKPTRHVQSPVHRLPDHRPMAAQEARESHPIAARQHRPIGPRHRQSVDHPLLRPLLVLQNPRRNPRPQLANHARRPAQGQNHLHRPPPTPHGRASISRQPHRPHLLPRDADRLPQ